MQRVITATGREFPVKWCGIATFDSALRFGIENSQVSTVTTTFLNPQETETLIHAFDETQTEYHGFTTFKGIEVNPDGTITVALLGGST